MKKYNWFERAMHGGWLVVALLIILTPSVLTVQAFQAFAQEGVHPCGEQISVASQPVLTGLIISPYGAGVILANLSGTEEVVMDALVEGTTQGKELSTAYPLYIKARAGTMVAMFSPWKWAPAGEVLLHTSATVSIILPGEELGMFQRWDGFLTAYAPTPSITPVITDAVRIRTEHWKLDQLKLAESLKAEAEAQVVVEQVKTALLNDIWPVEGTWFPILVHFVWGGYPHFGVAIAPTLPAGETVWVEWNGLGSITIPQWHPLTHDMAWASEMWSQPTARFVAHWDEHQGEEGWAGELSWLLGIRFPQEQQPPSWILPPTR